jgi:redox-sensitive bicupin YhaK (pirin superfamily)
VTSPTEPPAPPGIRQILQSKPRDLGGGIIVGRVLPQIGRHNVGPFVFLDHMGPVALAPGGGMDVRPHPHIGLATVTWLFEGEIVHRDSLGVVQPIKPGELNWMTAGRGIVHSERSNAADRVAGVKMHGLQFWVALPLAAEETAPAFHHYDAHELPIVELPGARVHVLAGSSFGATSPVTTASTLFYTIIELQPGATVELPDEHTERAVYITDGSLTTPWVSTPRSSHTLLFLERGSLAITAGTGGARLAYFGGDPLDAPRHLLWNFVSSSKERLAQARDDWEANRFPPVPGDDERIPFPAPTPPPN